MCWWAVLDVPKGSSRKEIRKAYARLVKEHRPDEHPKEFQRVNEAYQQAMIHLRSAGDRESDRPQNDPPDEEGCEQVLISESSSKPAASMALDYSVSSSKGVGQGFGKDRSGCVQTDFAFATIVTDMATVEESVKETETLQKLEIEHIKSTVYRLLSSPERADVARWDFIDSCEWLLDTQFRYRLTGEVLRIIGRHNLSKQPYPSLKVGEDVMIYLDRYLNFSGSDIEDYPQVTIEEWDALIMPWDNAVEREDGECIRGVRGGRVLVRRTTDELSHRRSTWSLIKVSVFYSVMLTIIVLGVISVAVKGGVVFIYIWLLIAIVRFAIAFLKNY